MQFDANMMKKLLAESDTALWETIRTVAAENGIPLPAGRPSAGDMARLRAILASRGERDIADAMETLRRARGGQ
jgi:hypothetical protein